MIGMEICDPHLAVNSKKNQYPVGRLKGITALLTAWAMDKSRMSVQRLPTICMP
ncbi:MAG: hypothetical protein HOC09_23550, partial [Deltaproteobacteria bacterium]|nr:hypothetical protein [Deltaproteobacteria bacterium]